MTFAELQKTIPYKTLLFDNEGNQMGLYLGFDVSGKVRTIETSTFKNTIHCYSLTNVKNWTSEWVDFVPRK